jgi:CO/xanthine dehydrogenase FAD-binding subunit
MITSYHRPETLEQTLSMLADPFTAPLAGGTWINSPLHDKSLPLSVIDLQALGLNRLATEGESLEIDACVTLQRLLEAPQTPSPLKRALKLEAPVNIRNMATVAGTLVVADGRSPCGTALLALDARLTLAGPGSRETIGLGDLFALRGEILGRRLIIRLTLPLNAALAWEHVSRTPSDKPLLSVALARWPSGRLRMAVGGFGSAPLLALDAPDPAGIGPACRDALNEAADEWGSAEYRREVGAILATRCIRALEAEAIS